MRRPDTDLHGRLSASLDRTALDPAAWSEVCDDLAGLVGGAGAVLIPADVASSGVALPHSPALDEGHDQYIGDGWYKRDLRVTHGFPRAVHSGYATDQDLIEPEAMRREPYYGEFLAPLGLQWFVAVTFNVKGQLWAASVQGTTKRGPFLSNDVETLLRVRQHLGFAARRTAAVGDQRLESLKTAFASAERGVVALDVWGRISWLNEPAEEMLREAALARSGRLRSLDPPLHRRLSDLIDAALGFRWAAGLRLPGPVQVPARDGRVFSLDAVPMPRDFQAILSGVTVLVTIHEVAPPAHDPAGTLRERFGLTAREAELARHLLNGRHLADAAIEMQVTVATARQHLKAVFAKTGTHRQGELVALLTRSRSG